MISSDSRNIWWRTCTGAQALPDDVLVEPLTRPDAEGEACRRRGSWVVAAAWAMIAGW